MNPAKLHLDHSYFSEKEKVILQSGCLSASTFLFPSGVCGLRVANDRGQLVILPYQGQQIWSACFDGRNLVMKSIFDYPLPTTDYLGTYGGFMIHCGATAMGVPAAGDKHPLHGELPNLPYEQAYIAWGQDEQGQYLAVGGSAEYRQAFSTHYAAEPEIRLYEGSTLAAVAMKLTNLRANPMDYMYLCHINFRPIDGSYLVDSAPADPQHYHVHMNVPSDLPAEKQAALRSYMQEIALNPAIHQAVDSRVQLYDPEIVLSIKLLADQMGYAHSMQVLPEGDAFYVAYRVEHLPIALRWIARTGDEDALGLVLPATAEHHGYNEERKQGHIRTIVGLESVTMHLLLGYLDRPSTILQEEKIRALLK